MRILVVAATEFEIEPFTRDNNIAEVLIAGVGITGTVYNLTKTLFQNKYDLVIQAGIAGTFNKTYSNGDVVVVSEDTFGDAGIEEKNNFHTLFETGFAAENDLPYTGGWLLNGNPVLETVLLPKAKAITVNMVTDNKERIARIAEKFNPDVESMEGAAFHYVCLREKVNFLQIRSISNEVGERDKTKWAIANAIANLNIELKKVVQNFN